MRIIIGGCEKTVVSYAGDKRKRQIFVFFLGAFSVRFSVRRKYNIHISLIVFNIKLIKVLCISLYSNNRINISGFFVGIIKRLEIIKR